jgi:hypothetical protein
MICVLQIREQGMGTEFSHSAYAVEEWFNDKDCRVNIGWGRKKGV